MGETGSMQWSRSGCAVRQRWWAAEKADTVDFVLWRRRGRGGKMSRSGGTQPSKYATIQYPQAATTHPSAAPSRTGVQYYYVRQPVHLHAPML